MPWTFAVNAMLFPSGDHAGKNSVASMRERGVNLSAEMSMGGGSSIATVATIAAASAAMAIAATEIHRRLARGAGAAVPGIGPGLASERRSRTWRKSRYKSRVE